MILIGIVPTEKKKNLSIKAIINPNGDEFMITENFKAYLLVSEQKGYQSFS